MESTDRVVFDQASAKRIANVVRAVENPDGSTAFRNGRLPVLRPNQHLKVHQVDKDTVRVRGLSFTTQDGYNPYRFLMVADEGTGGDYDSYVDVDVATSKFLVLRLDLIEAESDVLNALTITTSDTYVTRSQSRIIEWTFAYVECDADGIVSIEQFLFDDVLADPTWPDSESGYTASAKQVHSLDYVSNNPSIPEELRGHLQDAGAYEAIVLNQVGKFTGDKIGMFFTFDENGPTEKEYKRLDSVNSEAGKWNQSRSLEIDGSVLQLYGFSQEMPQETPATSEDVGFGVLSFLGRKTEVGGTGTLSYVDPTDFINDLISDAIQSVVGQEYIDNLMHHHQFHTFELDDHTGENDRYLKTDGDANRNNMITGVIGDGTGTVIDPANQELIDGAVTTVDWDSGTCHLNEGGMGATTVDWLAMELLSGNVTVDWDACNLKEKNTGQTTVDWITLELNTAGGVTTVDWDTCILVEKANGRTTVDWAGSQLTSHADNVLSVDWADRQLYGSGNVAVGSWDKTALNAITRFSVGAVGSEIDGADSVNSISVIDTVTGDPVIFYVRGGILTLT